VELATMTGVFGPSALAIIADHHRYVDGSGWPPGKAPLGLPTAIVSLVNRYDRLCSPEAPDRESLMPSEALSRLFKVESAKFDRSLLGTLIKLLGVFPPGTIVRLNDESLALVVSAGRHSLRPIVLIYSPEMNKRDAPTVDLALASELKIEEAIRPASLPADVVKWLNPRQRLSYFFSVEQES
jgi:hypothetical protein